MPPFQELFNSQEFWSAVIISLIGGGGIVGALITAWSSRRSKAQEDRDSAEADKLATEAAQAAVQILTDSVIQPLREQVDKQAAQIQHLEEKQFPFWASRNGFGVSIRFQRYGRALGGKVLFLLRR